jgi:hypothetical protein
MKWIVLWTVINSFLTPCKFPDPVADQFGRIPSVIATPAIACYDTTEKKMTKEFYLYEDAVKFMEEGKKQSGLIDWNLYENKK